MFPTRVALTRFEPVFGQGHVFASSIRCFFARGVPGEDHPEDSALRGRADAVTSRRRGKS